MTVRNPAVSFDFLDLSKKMSLRHHFDCRLTSLAPPCLLPLLTPPQLSTLALGTSGEGVPGLVGTQSPSPAGWALPHALGKVTVRPQPDILAAPHPTPAGA